MYVYIFNGILMMEMKNRSDKEMIRDFIEVSTDLKIREINPGYHFIYNESSIALKMTMTTMDINYHFPPTDNHRANISYRAIQTLKNNFISGLCSTDKDLHLKFQQVIININIIKQSRIHPHL